MYITLSNINNSIKNLKKKRLSFYNALNRENSFYLSLNTNKKLKTADDPDNGLVWIIFNAVTVEDLTFSAIGRVTAPAVATVLILLWECGDTSRQCEPGSWQPLVLAGLAASLLHQGGTRKGGTANSGSSQVFQLWYDPNSTRVFMFSMNVIFVRPLLMNFLCSACKLVLFLGFIKPVLLTLKQKSVQVYPVISARKGVYFWVLSLCVCSLFILRGIVSSNIWMVFMCLSSITISSFRLVTHRAGGIVPPLGVPCLANHWIHQTCCSH